MLSDYKALLLWAFLLQGLILSLVHQGSLSAQLLVSTFTHLATAFSLVLLPQL